MSSKCEAKMDLSTKFIGKKYRVEKCNESRSGHYDRWAVVFDTDSIVESFDTEEAALDLMDSKNALFEMTAWQSLREWFDSIDKTVEDTEFRQDQPHMWWQYLGLRMAMGNVARGALGMDWYRENRAGVCNMYGIRDCDDKAVNYFA